MEIVSIRHKALKRFYETGIAKGLDGNLVYRLGRMLALISDAAEFGELFEPPNYGLHPLVGNREGEWAMIVSRNWRLTFRKADDEAIADLNLEDYH